MSCTELIELPHESPRLVVEAYLSNGGELNARISQSISKTDSMNVPQINDAELLLIDAKGTEYPIFAWGNGNYYTNGVADLPGQSYTLQIQYKGNEYTAQSVMPAASLRIDSLKHSYVLDSVGMPQNSRLTVFYSNPSLTPLQGLLMIHVDSSTCCMGQLFNDPSPAAVSAQVTLPLGEQVPAGRRIQLNVFESDPMTFEIFKELAFFQQGSGVGGLTVAPPINVSSNFDGDALGFFAAVRMDTASVVVR